MEEWIGGLWDRWITQTARRDHPDAAVELKDIEKALGVIFRALGGDPGLRIAAAADQAHGARRRLLQRIAGIGQRVAHAALDHETLVLPPRLAVLPTPSLNRDLYVWLAALAASAGPALERFSQEWIVCNQFATWVTLQRYPGLESRYRRLVEAVVAERIPPEKMPDDEAAQERAVLKALFDPGSVAELPPLARAKAKTLQPVPLWLYPAPPAKNGARRIDPLPTEAEGEQAQEQSVQNKRYQAERDAPPENASPLILLFRAESLLSWAEYLRVNRALDADENPDAGRAAESLEKLTLAENDVRVASKVRFDLDLPAAAEDDLLVGPGIPLPEWDWKRRIMKPDFCRVQTMVARDSVPQPLPERLKRHARKLKNQFAALAPVRRWQKAQPEGSELDIDACVRIAADRLAGWHFSGAGAYLNHRPTERDLACLVLADLSLSTDAYANDRQKVIDVIRDSLMLFGEALSATGDAFAFYGFSSLKRSFVRFHEIKPFDRPLDTLARGRIAALKPGWYTRMGAAVRRARQLIEKQPAQRRLLLILSDGKPHDIDLYEGRYGIEDTRMALIEAREAGIKPFCVTIDREGAGYLPHLFGPAGYTIVRKPEELPDRLPLLYAQLTGNA
ncbi:nitric oxide reductase activation protein NorD [Sulfuricystis multivorans]|uniref:nitric oxide reductase activation protein NorD n=1 Tax=Sulfuricystis multivorans TaxID=2211108 RepID=UPI000F825BD6|nr:nitric oxide reductase [Sulfuricystis multivorans]